MDGMAVDYMNVLREAAPIGASVTVATVADGWVRLYVDSENGPNFITHRVANVLDVPYDSDRDAVAGDGELVRRLSLLLHGGTGCLFSTLTVV